MRKIVNRYISKRNVSKYFVDSLKMYNYGRVNIPV